MNKLIGRFLDRLPVRQTAGLSRSNYRRLVKGRYRTHDDVVFDPRENKTFYYVAITSNPSKMSVPEVVSIDFNGNGLSFIDEQPVLSCGDKYKAVRIADLHTDKESARSNALVWASSLIKF